MPPGQILEKVVCAGNAAQSYALYLPSNYTPDKKWPILYAFDPGARGRLPVERFCEGAEQYGWIVAGSNTSRNGSLQTSLDAWNAMSKDTQGRFTIDQQRVYAAGFSGGARVAILFATVCHDCLAGVVACGAGFPVGRAPSATNHFAFFGAVGVDDFNFPEVRGLDDALSKAGVTHRIDVFAGRHDWAPPALATEAIAWMELQAIKARQRQRDDKLIDALWQDRYQRAKALDRSGKLYESYRIYVDLADTFKGLRDVGEAEKRASELRDSREVKDAIRDEQRQIKKQRELENQINSLISGPERNADGFDTSTQLASIVTELQKSAKTPDDSAERRISRRVTEGMFVGLFEQGLDLLQTQKRYDAAARQFKLATEVAPERPGAFFYLASAYALNGEKKKSLAALKSAIEKGFTDLSAINDNRAFDSMRNDPQFLKIIQSPKVGH